MTSFTIHINLRSITSHSHFKYEKINAKTSSELSKITQLISITQTQCFWLKVHLPSITSLCPQHGHLGDPYSEWYWGVIIHIWLSGLTLNSGFLDSWNSHTSCGNPALPHGSAVPIHACIQQILTEHLLCIRHCSRPRDTIIKKTKSPPPESLHSSVGRGYRQKNQIHIQYTRWWYVLRRVSGVGKARVKSCPFIRLGKAS